MLSAIISNEKMDSMRQLASELSSAVEEMTATNEELSAASMDVSKRLDGLVISAETMTDDIQQINQIVELVKGIATKSQILGLNASIEAARSGEHGKGFAVVAKEIQKMAQNSKDVTKPATFNVEFGGKGTNPWGVEVYGFEGETKINREEFGLTWNAALETGGVLVGKDIKVKVEFELNPVPNVINA